MTRRILTLAVLCLTPLAWPAPGLRAQAPAQNDLASPTLRIGWEEFKKLYDANAVIVVDVRDPASFQTSRIPGSRNVPLNDVEKQVPSLRSLTRPIVFYCA